MVLFCKRFVNFQSYDSCSLSQSSKNYVFCFFFADLRCCNHRKLLKSDGKWRWGFHKVSSENDAREEGKLLTRRDWSDFLDFLEHKIINFMKPIYLSQHLFWIRDIVYIVNTISRWFCKIKMMSRSTVHVRVRLKETSGKTGSNLSRSEIEIWNTRPFYKTKNKAAVTPNLVNTSSSNKTQSSRSVQITLWSKTTYSNLVISRIITT